MALTQTTLPQIPKLQRLPGIDPEAAKLLLKVIEAIREVLEVGTGKSQRGHKYDRWITLRDLTNAGIDPSSLNKGVESTILAQITLDNEGLHIRDIKGTRTLTIKPGSNLTKDRTLAIVTGDSDRTITIQGNPTLDDWFDQAVKTLSRPTFLTLFLSGLSASRLIATDSSKKLVSTILADWIQPGSDISVSGNPDGTVTISIVDTPSFIGDLSLLDMESLAFFMGDF